MPTHISRYIGCCFSLLTLITNYTAGLLYLYQWFDPHAFTHEVIIVGRLRLAVLTHLRLRLRVVIRRV